MTINQFPIKTRTVDFQQIIDAKGYADDAEAARDAAEVAESGAETARTQAELAATAAGATLYDSTASGLAGTTDGDVFLVSSEPGVQVYRNDTGSETFLGWLGRVRFDDVNAFFAHNGSFVADTLVEAVAEGRAYRAVDTGGDVQNSASPTPQEFVEVGSNFTTLDRFKAAIIRGDTYQIGAAVVASGVVYRYEGSGTEIIAGLAGWVQQTAKITGGITNLNTARNGYNFLASDADASLVQDGTNQQPNLVGAPCEVFEFTGDGLTTAFACSTALNVTDEDYLTVRVFLIDGDTRALALETEGTDFTVSGYGTGTVTINMTTAPPTGDVLRVRLYEKTDAGNAPLLNFSGLGYDNITDGSGSQTIVLGAHHTDIGNAGGHNTFVGGSSSYAHNTTSYSFIAGLSHDFDGVLGGFAAGGRGYLTGSWPAHFGNYGKVGTYSAHFGEGGDVEAFYSSHFGRRGKANIGGEMVSGAGAAADTDPGMVQSSRYSLRRGLSGTTNTTLIPVTGSSTYVIPENSIVTIECIVSIVDRADLDNFIKLKVETTVKRESGGGETVVIGDNSAAADQVTVLDRGGTAANVNGTSWDAQIFGSGVSGGFVILARGGSGLTCMCHAAVDVNVISADAD